MNEDLNRLNNNGNKNYDEFDNLHEQNQNDENNDII